MRSPEQRVRKWLRVYPRAYRERRGDEVVATLLDKARDDPRLRAREVASLLAHGSKMRFRALHVVAIAVLASLVGAGVGTGIGLWGGPSGYASAATVRPDAIHAAPDPIAWLTSLSTRFAGALAAPATFDRNLTAPYPSCSDTVLTSTSSPGISVACTAPSARSARTATSDLLSAFGVMFEGLNSKDLDASRNEIAFKLTSFETQLGSIRREITTTRNPIVRGGLAHNYNLVTDQIANVRQLSGLIDLELTDPGALLTEVHAPTTAIHDVTALPVALGAAAGLVIGLAFWTRRRRAPKRPLTA